MRVAVPTAILLLFVVATAVAASQPREDRQADDSADVFCIGEIDGRAAEFGLVSDTYKKYQDRYARPVVFTVGKDSPKNWPHVHPSTRDTWAGGKAHTFTIRFKAETTVRRPLVLTLGLADAVAQPAEVTVKVNGKALPGRRAPKGNGRLIYRPRSTRGDPKAMAFEIASGEITEGENEISITLRDGGWIIYDFVCLGDEKRVYEPPDLLAEALKGPLAGTPEIVFAVRQPGKDGHWYANFSYYAESTKRITYGDGGKLCRLNLRTGQRTVLLDDPHGGIRDPQVHYGGRRIVFSYRRGGSLHYRLYEINIDGTGLRQLTDGPYDDIEPTYVPDGGIVFCSSRCNRWVNCWLTQVAVLYRCDADGKNVRQISSNLEHDNTPWPLPDGRILYQRWEYIDRSQVHYHHLWTANPDGTGQMIYFGNQNPGTVMIDAKPIPGTDRVLAIFSPGHGRKEHAGDLTIVDPSAGPDRNSFAETIPNTANCRDPYPLSETCYLAARDAALLLVNRRGETKTIYSLSDEEKKAGLHCHEPRPLHPRPRERMIPPRIDPATETGHFILADVYKGRNMGGVKPGEIKKLLVLETLPKPINFTGGMEPLSYGGTFTLERVLGTVPVEPDGSAYLEVPAMRSVFFVALDENDLSVKRMQSFTSVQPGEVTSCVGCHEPRTQTTLPKANLMATRRAPSRIEPIEDVPDVFDFPRDIQPILDRHCVKCHGCDKREGGVLLTGDRGPMFSHSYFMLTAREQVADGRNRPKSNYPPRGIGSSASPLMKMIDGSHYDVKVSDHERRMIRLWIETGAPYPGTYAGLGCGMIGGYAQNQLDRSDTEWPSMKAAMDVLKNRCGRCHTGKMKLPTSPSDNMGMPPWNIRYGDPRLRFSRHILYNLTRPEKSVLLLAPLAKEAGGYGICRPGGDTGTTGTAAVFASANDPDHRTILAAIRDTAKRLGEIKRFDMPGFRPRAQYVREMKRYGVLPGYLADDAPIDVYEADRAYWRSLWYCPNGRQDAPP